MIILKVNVVYYLRKCFDNSVDLTLKNILKSGKE